MRPGLSALAILITMCANASGQMRLIVLDPGHFHASLVQKEMYSGLDPTVSVYAPMTPDVVDYLNRVALFNSRKDHPTAWNIELHASPDFVERMIQEHPGNVVVIAGRNRPKIDRIEASIKAGLNVLCDKPWIISSRDLPRLERALELAREKNLVAYDIMTERYEITSILQKELVNNESVFGKLVAGSDAEPAVDSRSIHHLMKAVAGVPLRRPVWFFDVAEYGEGLADVGTHLVDLVQWTAFPNDVIDYRKDVHITGARRWPTILSHDEFERVTGESQFPPALAAHVTGGKLAYDCNNSVHYTVHGTHIALDVRWNWESPHGDIYEATFRGTKSRIELRQGESEKFVPELYVVSGDPQVFNALEQWAHAMQKVYPGLAIDRRAQEPRLAIPEKFRVGHEEHFGQVTIRFFDYLKSPATIPAWEESNMLVKYFVSTRGTEAGQH